MPPVSRRRPARRAAPRSRRSRAPFEHAPVVADVVGRADAVVYGNSSAPMKFARRTSAGSSDGLDGERSTARSSICVASGRPAPRTGPIGLVLVTTESNRTSIRGIRTRRTPSSRSALAGSRRFRDTRRRRCSMPHVSALTFPVAAAAELEPIRWPRPWPIATMCSERVSVQRTGRPSLRASQPTSTSSDREPLAAEAAADVRRDHVHAVGLDPERRGRARLGPGVASACGARCVSRPFSHTRRGRARLDRATWIRWLTTLPLTTTSQPVEQVGVGLCGRGHGRRSCPRPRTDNVLVRERRLARRSPPGSGSVSAQTRSAASTPAARLSVSTTATMSPTNRTLSAANSGRNICGSIAG